MLAYPLSAASGIAFAVTAGGVRKPDRLSPFHSQRQRTALRKCLIHKELIPGTGIETSSASQPSEG